MSEVDFKSEVGCFSAKSIQVVLAPSRDFKSTSSHFRVKWGQIGSLKSLPGLVLYADGRGNGSDTS